MIAFGGVEVEIIDLPGHLVQRIARAHSAAFDPGSPMLAALGRALDLSEDR